MACCLVLEHVTRRMLLTLVCAASILTPHAGAAQTGDADTPFVHFRGDEWALEGGSLRDVLPALAARDGWRPSVWRGFPASANTVAWLAQADRLGDALDVLQRIIDRQPTRIADALEALDREELRELRRDQSHGYQARLDGLIAAARRTLPGLDREAAARLEIVLLAYEWTDRRLSSTRDEFEVRQRAVLERHRARQPRGWPQWTSRTFDSRCRISSPSSTPSLIASPAVWWRQRRAIPRPFGFRTTARVLGARGRQPRSHGAIAGNAGNREGSRERALSAMQMGGRCARPRGGVLRVSAEDLASQRGALA